MEDQVGKNCITRHSHTVGNIQTSTHLTAYFKKEKGNPHAIHHTKTWSQERNAYVLLTEAYYHGRGSPRTEYVMVHRC